MQTNHKPESGKGASLSRRTFLQFAAAGSAATLPAMAEAATAKIPQLPLTDQQQLDACIDQLKAILQRMHPGYDHIDGGYQAHKMGGAAVILEASRPPVEWSGPGFYEVEDHHRRNVEGVFWVVREWSDMDRRFYLCGLYHHRGQLHSPSVSINPRRIVRKLEGGAT
ncbi:twin-arginine translocation signal domain-containing protein [Rhizobium rhizogenes]|uniref:twin-arginine translocation signal domain-containing protein n=1 Tax=Rhizobium rhizogenes TaxID=359 RepID=UPI0004D699F3|nr:twin-arginine translocation signal domain-containing protein [Rhizobium rhizogenes]KEA04836.1 hypothetical protein CN09_13380 [Rhizobium rhizogenes]NTI79170.1 hypothetical protein [Rhizobium rhizogenes]NTJ21271.1 hypothetical protein [Rhizobium rhizogenes]QUE80034.1 hypothetical protein EML492_18915 [Rhizobium rhizogenes]TQO78137.1 hypothetical protein FFE80_16770 [Rhizobium rhizogenes]